MGGGAEDWKPDVPCGIDWQLTAKGIWKTSFTFESGYRFKKDLCISVIARNM